MPRPPLKALAVWRLIKKAVLDWLNHDAFAQAAAISFFAVFSLAPLLVIAVGVAGLLWERGAVRTEIVDQFTGLVGKEGGELMGTIIDTANKPEKGVLAAIIGIGTLIISASGAFAQLRAALNLIWEVKPSKGLGILRFIRARIASFAMVLGLAFLLLVSLAVSAGLAALSEWSSSLLPKHEVLMQIANFLVGFLVIAMLFAGIYKVLPDARINWRETLIGAVITAALFSVGKSLIGLYLGHASPGSAYGAAGSLAIVLVWIYYSSLIFLLGAEITHRHALSLGKHNPPKEGAEAAPDLKKRIPELRDSARI
jgi:membrane protein